MVWRAPAGLPLALGLALSACSNGSDAPTPPPVSGDEQQAVAEAAEMLSERESAQDAEVSGTSMPGGNE